MGVVLHISNDYAGSTVYKNLIGKLDCLGIKQIVYTPVKSTKSIGNNEIDLKEEGSKIIYSNILNKTFDRAFYRLKIKKILSDIESKIDFSRIDYIHAHTWYSDGGVAYLLHKKYHIPYIVTIRNSDLNIFQKYLIHERGFGQKVLKHAQHIILISASYKHRLLGLSSLAQVKSEIENKTEIIPNGVDPFWINNALELNRGKKLSESVSILYIGRFSKNKNIHKLQEAIRALNEAGKRKIALHIVGGGGGIVKRVLSNIKSNPDIFVYHGKIYEKEQLQAIFRSCDMFAMPSSGETFGLVYVEAMLQGLPILFTKNEGIDGFYIEKIGENVSKTASVQEIKEKLQIMTEKYSDYEIPLEKIKQNHDWSRIANEYQLIYQGV